MKLSERMKQYEKVAVRNFPERLPVIVRLDGRAFHTLTQGLQRPFDREFMEVMQLTMSYVCGQTQNAKLGYAQSDEISILMVNYAEINTQSWFGNRQNKIESISAGLASAFFVREILNYSTLSNRFGVFDSRAFVLPQHEVENYFIWRWQDCTRNSVSSVAQSYFSHKELNKKNQSQQHDMLHHVGVNWATDFNGFEKDGTVWVDKKFGPAPNSLDGWREIVRKEVYPEND